MITATIDSSLYYKVKEQRLNMSGLINSLLENYFGAQPVSKSSLDALKEEAEKQAAELEKSRSLIKEAEDKLKKEEMEKIAKEGTPFKFNEPNND